MLSHMDGFVPWSSTEEFPNQPLDEYLAQRFPQCFLSTGSPSELNVYVGHHGGQQQHQGFLDVKEDRLNATSLNWLKLSSVAQLEERAKQPTDAFYFLRQKNSRSRVNATFKFFYAFAKLNHIETYVQELVACFGVPGGEHELGPPACRFQWRPCDSGPVDFYLESAYVLTFAQLHHRETEEAPWSMRQSLIYHRHPSKSSPSFIFMVSASELLRDVIIRFLSNSRKGNSLQLDCMLIATSVSTWRPYLVWVAEALRKQADRAIVADFDVDGVRLSRLEEQQSLKILEDMILDTINAIESSLATASRLLKKCKETADHLKHSAAPTLLPKSQWDSEASSALEENVAELEHLRGQASNLLKKAKGARALVANILQLDNGNALQLLAIESKNENKIMQSLTQKATRDAGAVKVLTVITLVYLPTTAVLNFFSNGLVSFSPDSRLEVAGNWWIFVAFAAPLTVITLYSWWFYVRLSVDRRAPAWLKFVWPSVLEGRRGNRPHRQQPEEREDRINSFDFHNA